MLHALIAAHPNQNSFTLSMARAYGTAAEMRGHKVVLRDLYRMGFEPRMAADEIPWTPSSAPHDDVKAERETLKDAGVFVLFYPLWLNAPPAIMKGYLERVFGLGFAYGRGGAGNEPLLKGRKLISFSASGAPAEWVKSTGAFDAMRKLFDEHVAGVCGLTVLDHIHFGGIVPNIRKDVVDAHLEAVRATVAKYF